MDPSPHLLSFWRSGTFSRSASSTQINALHLNHGFLTFLAITQRLNIDILPINWQPAMDRVGEGATAEIRQSLVNLQTNFVFKRFKGSLDESAVVHALISEIMILADTHIRKHENIIKLEGICWDIPVDGYDIRPVLVFEKSQYGDLEQFLSSDSGSNIDSQTRLKLCLDVGLAILSMHSNSIIHGDIKPKNVLVFGHDSDNFLARVTDFGYSTRFAGENFIYMPRSQPWDAPEHHHRGFSPEQAMQMDIYSFGMVCFWLIFERELSEPISLEVLERKGVYNIFPPQHVEFQGQNILWNLKSENLLPKLAGYLLATNSNFNETQKHNLRIFFESSLVKDPEQRCSDIRQLLSFLDQGETVANIPLFAKQEAASFHENFQIMPSIRQLYRADFRLRSYVALNLDKILISSIQKPCHDEACLQKSAFQLAFCYKLGFGVQRDDKKSEELLRQSLRQKGELEDEVELLRQPWPRQRFHDRNVNDLDSLGHIGLFDYGQIYRQYKILDVAEREYKREIADVESVLGDKHSIVAILMSTLASVFRNQGRWSEAEELDTKLLEAVKNKLECDSSEIASVTFNLAADLLNQGKYEVAEKMNCQVLNDVKEALGVNHIDTLGSMNNLALTYFSRGKVEAAEEMHRLALEGYTKVLGKKHPKTLASMNNLALAMQSQVKHTQAGSVYCQALELYKEILGNEHPDTLATMNNLGLTIYKEGKYDEARDIFQQVLDLRNRVLGKEHPSTLSTVHNLALVLDHQGCYETAGKLFECVFLGNEKVLGAEHPNTLLSMTKVASILGKQRKYPEAEDFHHRVIERHEAVFGKRHPYTIIAISELGLILLEQGKTDGSSAIFQRAYEQGRGYGR